MTPRRPERPTVGPRIAEVARQIGWEPMPWQLAWWDVIGEYYIDDDTGLATPFYREVDDITPRQSAKTSSKLSWAFERCLFWTGVDADGVRWGDGPQRIAWTAQSRTDAAAKWVDELYPRIWSNPIAKLTQKTISANGFERIVLKNDSRIILVSNKPSAGHGGTIHGAVLDEMFADYDGRRLQALGPAMLTVANGQRTLCSTAGDHKSTVLNARIARGRRAVDDGVDRGLAYLEYSAPEGWVAAGSDPEEWYTWMPALGHTVTIDAIGAEMAAMSDDPGEAERAYGCLTNLIGQGSAGFIPLDLFELLCRPEVRPDGDMILGVAVESDRSSSAIAVADSHGRVELIDHRQGTDWIEARANDIAERRNLKIVIADAGPEASLAELDESRLVRLSGRQVAEACGWMFDRVLSARGLQVRAHPDLTAAVGGAARADVGKAFEWSRKVSTKPVAPLYAVTQAAAYWSIAKAADPFAYVAFIPRR